MIVMVMHAKQPAGNFRRLLAAAAGSLSRLAAAAAAVIDQHGHTPPWLLQQVDAGCSVLASCADLATRAPQLSAQAAAQLGAACSLLLGPGSAVLGANMAALQSQSAALAVQALADSCYFQTLGIVLIATDVLLPKRQPAAASAFVSNTATPAAVLSWLRVLSQAVPLMARGAETGECRPPVA